MPDAPESTDTVHRIPLAQINPNALPRDRTGLDGAAMDELINSICTGGLRMPIEVFPLEAPASPAQATPVDAHPVDAHPADAHPADAAPPRYGLISGYRRYHAFARLHADEVRERMAEQPCAAIPAFIRPRAALARQLVQVVEENAIRADLSPWERGHVAVAAWREGIFDTLDAAVNRLYMCASRQKRARLRAAAGVVEEFDGCLAAPECLSENRLTRLARAIQAGFAEVMREALESSSRTTPEAQWELILPYLLEAERPAGPNAPPRREGRPRRLARIRRELHIRREMTPQGWVLHFSGEEATSDFVDEIIDEIERRHGR
jgi:ParB family chromosome partitioning protein